MEQENFPRRLHKGFQFFVRYFVAAILLFYATPKLMGVQFQVPLSVYDAPLGKIGDFWSAWAFFAHSYYYQFFIGLAEITIGFLLLFRRTKTLGVCCALPIVCNVLMVDYFFKVTDAMPVAIVLFLGVIYLLALEIPRLKTFFWDEQQGSSSSRKVVGSLIFGVVILSLGLGLDVFLTQTQHLPEAAYKIEKYSVNGTPLNLAGGKYTKDPTLYFEFGNTTVLSSDGKNTWGNYSINTERRDFTWIADTKQPEVSIKGTYKINGDEMLLQGRQGADDVEIALRRVVKDAP